MTEYQKTEWLHSQLSELIEGNNINSGGKFYNIKNQTERAIQ
jgi:hypothetical protein